MLHLPLAAATTLLTLTAGLLLITLEFNRPGLIVAGAAGLLATLVALASMARMPHGSAALGLLGLAALALARETRRPNALLTAAGATALAACFHLIAASSTDKRTGLLALGCAATVAVTTAVLARIAHRARVNKGLD